MLNGGLGPKNGPDLLGGGQKEFIFAIRWWYWISCATKQCVAQRFERVGGGGINEACGIPLEDPGLTSMG
jgi:hypothetical protein